MPFRKKPYRIGRAYTGLGLFATQPIRKRKRIVEYRGPCIAMAEAERRERSGNRYLLEIDKHWTIDGTSRRNIARYANHSCGGNAEAVILAGNRVWVRALRNIRPGEEITYDYGRDYLRNVIGAGNCKCRRCRRRRAKKAREARAAENRAQTRRKNRARQKRKSAR